MVLSAVLCFWKQNNRHLNCTDQYDNQYDQCDNQRLSTLIFILSCCERKGETISVSTIKK